MSKEKIDIVIMWVDGNDLAWQKEKAKYDSSFKVGNDANRFRDWNNLQYWFRSIEKFVPWVNKIHFVTYGHLPSWLNTDHPKLNIVNHKDFIPKQYLPTFNAAAIGANVFRIKGLSERFILFNDDIFILQPTTPEDFFKNGLPNSALLEDFLPINGHSDLNYIYSNVNTLEVLNRHFDKKEFIKKNRSKYFSLRYSKKRLFKNILLSRWGSFVGFYDTHSFVSFLKSTFEEVWEKEPELLDATCKNRFRTKNGLQLIMKRWQLCTGNFNPINFDKISKGFSIVNNDNDELLQVIENRSYKILCINDNSTDFDFDLVTGKIVNSFEKILPNKSKFEK